MNAEIEYYPMPSFPTLATGDLPTSAQWYQDVLGFRQVFEMPGRDGTPILVHLRWAKYADLLLVAEHSPSSGRKGIGVTLNFAVIEEAVDDLAARIVNRGGAVATGPIDRPWNAREIVVLDPDGYRLVFTKPVDQRRSLEEVVNNVRHKAG